MSGPDRDPYLQELFAQTRRTLPDEPFVAQVAERLSRERRRAIPARALLCLTLLALALLFGDFAVALGDLITRQVVNIDHGIAGALLAPLNTVGALIAVALIGLRTAHRRLFGAGW